MWIITVVLVLLLLAVILFQKLHTLTLDRLSRRHQLIIAAVAVLVALSCILPMGLSPSYNGEDPDHRDQYEKTARAFLDGHLYLEDEPDPKLEELENPYDFYQRQDANIWYCWDHSYYKGHYYMYFGVVPVLLLFLPFRALFGVDLLAYHATQIFTVFFIIGLFALFYRLAKYFFGDLSLSAYLLLSAAVSYMSLWYIIGAPALYCTAISSAMCMAVWSLFFFFGAVWGSCSLNKATLLAYCGAIFGALGFGCRPTIALSNLIVIPLLVVFIKKRGFNKGILLRLLIAAAPYLLIGAGLMIYNALRFENPFEFGASYQLTAVDMSRGSMLSKVPFTRILANLHYYLLGMTDHENIAAWGVFITYPVLLLGFVALGKAGVRRTLRRESLGLTVTGFYLSTALILFADVIFSELTVDRYRADVYWLLGIVTFLMLGLWYRSSRNKLLFSRILCVLAVLTVAMSVLLYITPHDDNPTFIFLGHTPAEMQQAIDNYFAAVP